MPPSQCDGHRRVPGTSPQQFAAPSLHLSLLARPHLMDLFDSSETPTVLVQAPAGFGKTTAIRQWAEDDGRPVAWLTLSAREDDPVSMTRSLVCIVDQVAPEADALDAVSGPGPVLVDSVLPLVESALAEPPEPFVIVVDDLDTVTDRSTLGLLERLIDCVSPGSQIVLASRSLPAIGVARRTLEGSLTEIGMDELALTDDEVSAMLELSRPGLAPALHDLVISRVEGWPLGVQLAALALRNEESWESVHRALSGTGQLLSEYFREEVLDGVDPEDMDFLLRTSVLDSLSGESCDFLLDRSGSAQRLDRLVSTAHTLVTALHDSGHYRYHALFREMLLNQAQQSIPDDLTQLRLRAVDWYSSRGEHSAALEKAIGTGDPEVVLDTLLAESVQLILEGRPQTLRRWLDQLPDRHSYREDIRLALCEGWLALMQGQRRDLENWLGVAEDCGHDGPLADGSENARVAIEALRMVGSLGDSNSTLRSAEVLLAAGPGGSPFWSAAQILAAVSRYVMGLSDDVAETMQQAEFHTRGSPAPHAVALSHLAWNALREGHLREGRAMAREALREVEEAAMDRFSMVSIVFCVASYEAALSGDTEGSRSYSGRALELMESTRGVTDRGQGHLRLILAEAALSRRDDARELLLDASRHLGRDPDAVILHEWSDELHQRIEARASQRPVVELTPAEERVLQKLPSHLSLAEIGDQLFISRNTVKSHTLSIYRKLTVAGRSEAVEQALLLGLLDGPAEA